MRKAFLLSDRYLTVQAGALCALAIVPCVLSAQETVTTSEPDQVLRHSSALAFYVSKGFYGQELPTYVRYLPYTHEVAIPGWRFKASLPVLEIDGPGSVLVDIGSVGKQGSGLVAERGVGDLVLSSTYELPILGNNLPFLDITVDLKLPTADENRGLGTGRPDVGVQLDAYQSLGAVTLFGSIAYRYRHRSPVFEGLNDSASLSLGLSLPLIDNWQGGVIYDFRQAASEFSGETHEVLPYLSWAPSERWSVMFYVVKGFTEDSADRAAGLQLTRRW